MYDLKICRVGLLKCALFALSSDDHDDWLCKLSTKALARFVIFN